MAMEITSYYSNGTAWNPAAGSAPRDTRQEEEIFAGKGKETPGAEEKQAADLRGKNIEIALQKAAAKKAVRMNQYLKELAKLAPSVQVRMGISFSSARSGKTLTINPGLLNKMMHDPQQEKDTKDMIKGVELITKFMDGLYKATGKTLVYRNSYIDADGKYYAFSCVRDDRSYNMSKKLRTQRQDNAQRLIVKSRETAAKRRKELWEKKVKRKRNDEKKSAFDKAAQFADEKIAASKDGKVYLYDTDFRFLLKAAEEDALGAADTADPKEEERAGANLDLRG